MDALRRWYREIWIVDFEFTQPLGERPIPLCLVAREFWSGRVLILWIEGQTAVALPWSSGPDTLLVAYYASAELSCYLTLGWPFPARVLDLYAEFRCLSSGHPVPCGYGLLGALTTFGIEGMAAVDKADMRQLAIRGGPYTVAEREALLAYCQADVDAVARLLPAMLPALDVPRALLRGRYMCAAARMEWTGIPCDVATLTALRTHWDAIRSQLVQTLNRTYGVFVPVHIPLDPASRFGAAVLHTATARHLDPYALAVAVDHLWRERHATVEETRTAWRQARARTGLTAAQIQRWETAGHDAANWPGLDDQAAELATEIPALGLRHPPSAAGTYEDIEYAERLWELLRDGEDPRPQRHDPDLVRQAADLVEADPEGWAPAGPWAFSSHRFDHYLTRTQIPWPRLDSGALALDDATFRDMAKAYPAEIGPLRELRHALSQLKLHELAVGHDGRNRCLLSAFSSRSSRNQPSNSAYLFGPSCWLRGLIKPAPGRAVAYLDWSQQELAIAGVLSGDQAMQGAYLSGDFYLEFAKRAGAAPPEATKDTHASIREQFKTVALGVLYGLSAQGIARRLSLPPCEGRLLLQYHKEVFHQFWAWSDQVEMQGMLGGTLRTVFGWQLHASAQVNPRSLRNFPMQAHGAEMLRLACCLCTEQGIAVCAPVHDALLIEAPDADIEATVTQAQAAMVQASLLVLPGFPLRTEAKIVRYPERYMDPRGSEMWATIQAMLEETAMRVPF